MKVSQNKPTINLKSNISKIAGWEVNEKTFHNMGKFITSKNQPLVKAMNWQPRLRETAPLDLFITQNMKIGREEINDIKNFRDFIMNKIKNLGFKSQFIGNANMAITKTLSEALLSKESNNKAPSASGVQKYYKIYFPDYERFSIQQGKLKDCYFLAALDSLIKKDSGYEYVTSLFTSDNDYEPELRIKPHNYKTEIRWPQDHFAYWRVTDGKDTTPLWAKNLEIGFAKMTNKDLYKTTLKHFELNHYAKIWNEEPLTQDIFTKKSIYEKIKTLGNYGYSGIAYNLLGLQNVTDHSFLFYKKEDLINELNDPNIFICTSIPKEATLDNIEYSDSLINRHEYSLHGYDEKRDLFIISNPHYSGMDIKVDWKFLCYTCKIFTKAKLPEKKYWYEYHESYREPEWYEKPDKDIKIFWDNQF